ncbi:hypothetical protein OIU84_028267 [Salix udensis]|uniref:CCHC-type domain-containing protein n=1 Tax=Salix udensis TaxID=889485 RepID=A0AAD6KCK4_9ROSI|nr:hypothetical protein OIU84_028267 [Salix udensis]
MWMSWRMAYEQDYQNLVVVAGYTQNVLSTVRKMIVGEDPYQGSTEEQNWAYQDLERLTCDSMKDVMRFLNAYMILASKSGRMWLSPELSDKLFRKLPHIISQEIETTFFQKHPGLTIGVPIRIVFIWNYLVEMCKRAAIQRSLKDLSFCKDVAIPGYYNSKKYGLRKAKTYKGKPHKTHVRVIRNKDKHRTMKERTCKCYICGDPRHFARECPRNNGNINKVNYVDNLHLHEDWDVMFVEQGEDDSDTICSLSEHEGTEGPPIVQNTLPYDPKPTRLQEQIKQGLFHIVLVWI